MKKIVISAKIYQLYVNGQRTFIHVKKEQEEELKKIKFCEKILLVNEENEQDFIEQTFWFLYSFKKVERFIFLAFKCERKDAIYLKRMRKVEEILNYSHQEEFYISYVEDDYQIYLYRQMQSYSSFLYITDDISMPLTKLILKDRKSKGYVVIDTLKIKTGLNMENIINVYSMIPIEFVYLY